MKLEFPAGREPRVPIWAAPMAGGPTTVDLVSAVGEAGGLGFIAGGGLGIEAFEETLHKVAAATPGPWGVNLFLPGSPTADPDAVTEYRRRLKPWSDRFGVPLGEPVWNDDLIEEKMDALASHRPAVVSFTFGDPGADRVTQARGATGALILATATTPEEVAGSAASGVDGIVLQGAEAGGHRGVWNDDVAYPGGGRLIPAFDLLDQARAETELPLVAAGGLMNGVHIRRALRAGAAATQLGTAFLCAPEAGTPEIHRRALLEKLYVGTTVTRSFTGRPARGLSNSLAIAFPDAPSAYPEIHNMTRPIRKAAVEAGEPDAFHLWAGRGWREVTEEPAGTLMARLSAEAGLSD